MFERFAEEAVRSILTARDEAKQQGHGAVGTDHLLVGLVLHDNKVARLIADHGQSVAELRGAMPPFDLGDRPPPIEAPGDLPFSADAQKAISLSWLVAEEFRHNIIEPMHVVLAILRVDGSRARAMLGNLSLDDQLLAQQARVALTPSKKVRDRAGYHEHELEIGTPYGPVVLTLVQPPNSNRSEARIISLSSHGLKGPDEIQVFLTDFDRLLDSSSSGISVAFFRDLFRGIGGELETYLGVVTS